MPKPNQVVQVRENILCGSYRHQTRQFAYQPCIGVDDTIIYLLHLPPFHQEKTGGTVRLMLFDCSCAFNTIQFHRKHSWLPSSSPSTLQTSCKNQLAATWISPLKTLQFLVSSQRGFCGLLPVPPDQCRENQKLFGFSCIDLVDLCRCKNSPSTPGNDIEMGKSYPRKVPRCSPK